MADDFSDDFSEELDHFLDAFIQRHFPDAMVHGVLVLARKDALYTSQFAFGTGPLTDEQAVRLLEMAKSCVLEPDELYDMDKTRKKTHH